MRKGYIERPTIKPPSFEAVDKPSMTIKPSRPVTPKSDSSDYCKHNYAIAHKETLAHHSYHGYEEAKMIIIFYCTKCLELEKKIKTL